MKSKRVAITGLGIFCSIGKNVEEFLQSLKEGRTGIGPITLFDTSKYPSKIGAEVRDYRGEEFFSKKELKRLSRTDQFALIAAEEAVKASGIPRQHRHDRRANKPIQRVARTGAFFVTHAPRPHLLSDKVQYI